MSNEHSHPMERHCDVAIIGGSASGLAAALQLGRQLRSVIVVDSGEPRNATASHMHGYLGHEGVSPSEFAAIGRSEVHSYGVEVIGGRAVDVVRTGDRRFRVELENGHALVARRILAATGLVDVLPDIEGLSEHWGREVLHCPFCHGFEARDLRIVHVVTNPAHLHPARLFRQLTDRLTLIVDQDVDSDAAEINSLRAAGVKVVEGRAVRIVEDEDGQLVALELADGSIAAADAIAVGTRFKVRAGPFATLGLMPAEHPSGLGDFIEVGQTGETSVAGLYAVGNLVDPSQQVLQAAAGGSLVGAMIAFSLADEDLKSAVQPSAGEREWDRRHGGERMWGGRPNPTLVDEVSDLEAGRALDVGAGEGGDALWLAEQGWTVTASDISATALEGIDNEAAKRGLEIEALHADVNAFEALYAGAFDLVTAHFVPIHRTPDHRGIRNIVDAVATGGTLLVVSHDPQLMRHDGDHGHRSMFDHDAYEHPADFLELLVDSAEWRVLVHESRPRPSDSASPHPDDVVLRALRLAR